MGIEFRIFTAPNVDNECSQILSNSHNSRDGFDLILFGLDVHEECTLLREISNLIEFDLSFLEYPVGRIHDIENPVSAVEFLEYLQALSIALEQKKDFHHQLTYPYLNHSYFSQHGFQHDVNNLIQYLSCCIRYGAQVVWVDPDIT